MSSWVQLESGAHRCVIHRVEFTVPEGCSECAVNPADDSLEQTSPLPFLPGMPTAVEYEKNLLDLADWFLDKAKEPIREGEDPGKDNGRAKYAELALRATVAARDMGERREEAWNDERQQQEVSALKTSAPRTRRA